jgi:hypothetical protein
MVDVEKGHLVELLPQHKANRLNQLDALEHVRKVQKFDVAEVLVAGHVALPQEVPLVACAEDVDEEVDTGEHLKDIVNGEEGLELVRLAAFHQTAMQLS